MFFQVDTDTSIGTDTRVEYSICTCKIHADTVSTEMQELALYSFCQVLSLHP